MRIAYLYKKRFNDVSTRNRIWQVLVKNFFQQYVSQNDIVLDVACGYGEFINNIDCKTRYALDINPDSKKYLQKGVIFLKSSSIKIPLKSKSIDKIFVSNFFEHIKKGDIEKTIRNFSALLKKGGKVIVLQPNIRFCLKDYWMFFDHITPIDDRALDEIFSSFGFTVEKKIIRFLPYTIKSALPKEVFFVKIYLKFSLLWKIFGKQSFILYSL